MGIPFIGNPFAAPQTEYPSPIPPPGVPPTFQPVQVSFSCLWVPYVVGACKAFLQEATWETATQAELEQVLGQAQDLLTLLMVAGQGVGCITNKVPFSCPYNFQLVDGSPGWKLTTDFYDNSSPRGAWAPVTGWSTLQTFEPGGSDYWTFLNIEYDFGQDVAIGLVQTQFGPITLGSNYGNHLQDNLSGFRIFEGTTLLDQFLVPSNTMGGFSDGVMSHDFGTQLCNRLMLSFLVGVTQNSPSDGSLSVRSVVVSGAAAGFTCR